MPEKHPVSIFIISNEFGKVKPKKVPTPCFSVSAPFLYLNAENHSEDIVTPKDSFRSRIIVLLLLTILLVLDIISNLFIFCV